MSEGIYAKRFKRRDEFTDDEELAYRKDGTVPEVDDNERARLEDAGFDPDSRRPLVDVEAEREKLSEREAYVRRLEQMTPEEHFARFARKREEGSRL